MKITTTNTLLPVDGSDLQNQSETLVREGWIWFQSNWLGILIAAGIAAVIVTGLYALRGWALRLCKRGNGAANWYSIIGRAIARTTSFFIVMTAAQLVVGYAHPPEMIAMTVRFLFTIASVFQGAIWAREVIFGMVEHKTLGESPSDSLVSALGIIRLLVTIAVFAVALVVVLSNLGVNVTGLVAGLGVGGIAIGLAAQGIFADLFAALAILFDRPFRVGQNISYDTTSGTVERIGLKSTHVRSFNGELRIISNKNLLEKEIQNLTDRTHIRFSMMLGLSYFTPPEVLDGVPQMLKDIAAAEGATAVRAGFAAFSASTIDFEYIVEVPSADWNIAHPLRDRVATALLRRFAEAKIEIAFPTQTTLTAAPDGHLVMPYPDVQPVVRVDKEKGEA